MKKDIDTIISESINHFLSTSLILEKKSKSTEDKKEEKEDEKENDKDDKDSKKSKKKKKFRKNAIKKKGGLRGDFDSENDELFNHTVDDQEESSIIDKINNGYFNISAIAQKVYPDHTKEGAQSQLRKKLEGEESDSGSTYKLKNKEVKKLRSVIASYLS